jgi:putative ABC transport system permease protein
VFLCILGGLIGLILVYIMMKVATAVTPMEFALSPLNIIIGVGTSVAVGIISGLIPAIQASKMDPVAAIRA